MFYVLDERKAVVATDDPRAFYNFFAHITKRRVAWTELSKGVTVSTIFLGFNHRHFGQGPPIVFETMVETDYGWDDQRRYCTWAEAELGHIELVEELQKRVEAMVAT